MFEEFETNPFKEDWNSSHQYHNASNGELERAVLTFKQAIKIMASETGWYDQKLAVFYLSYRTIPHTFTDATPNELLFQKDFVHV